MSTSKNKQNYAVFNFENFSEAGLIRTFSKELAKNDAPSASITATNKSMKKDGVLTKKAKIYFESQQTAEIVIGEKGDIITLKINGKVQPTGLPKNLTDFAKHISQLCSRGQQQFDNSLKKRLARIKTDVANKKPANRSNAKRIEEAEKELEEVSRALATTKSKENKINDEWDSQKSKAQDLADNIVFENKRSKELRKIFNSLNNK